MRDNNHPALRVVALGEFADPIPPLAPRLAALDVVPLRSAALAQLPESLGNQDILLTELAWLEGLNTDQRDALVRRAAPAAGWVALTHPAARFKDLVTWQRLGVGHFFHEPLDPERLAGLVEDIHDRRAGAPIRAILLDDEESSLAYYGAVLRQAGIEVLAVQDPLLVLESLDAHQPDVLVLDIEMPGCRGPELATIVRQYPAYARLPVIFLTAMESMQDQLLARAAAAEDFLAKPVAPELLLAAVEAHAQRYRALLRGEALCERQQAQSRMGLEQLRQAIDAHAIVSIADEQGRIVHVNDKFCAISGYTREELLGQDHSLVKSGVHAAPFYADLWRTIRGGRVWHGEICNRRKNGALYWVDATIYPVLDGKGAPRQFISIRTDITAGKTAEQVMAESAHRLNATLESTKDGILAVDAAGKVLFMNRQFRRMWNMPENLAEAGSDDQLLAHALTQLVDPQGFMQQVESLYRSDQDSEDLIELADGRVFERNSRPLQDGGQLSGRVWSFHDITARRRAEQAAESAKERLRRGQIYANIGTWDWNIVTGELYWTERIAPLFGYPEGDLETSYDNFLAAIHPEDRQAVIDAVGACVERDAPYEIEHRVVWPDGTVRWLLERGFVQRDGAGRPVRMIGVVQDIDARKRAEEALVAAREAADRANQAKSDFLSSMSHELRTPMNVILGFAQMLEYDSAMTADQQDSVHEIVKAGKHLLELINEVLDLAKIESGGIDLSLEPVALDAAIEECLALMGMLADKRGIRLGHNGLQDAVVRADRTRLKQVLLNLLSNAIKYNRDGGSVRIDVRPQGSDRLRIEVSDTGHGIPADKLAQLFQPFNRLDAENSEIEGTGIGLIITRRLVEMMGGAVDVQSTVGVGSTFWIDLPLDTLPGAGTSATGSSAAHAARPAAADRQTVLYIEDNPANLKLVAQILGHVPHIHLLTAHTPDLGIELALARRPALVLLDINMPGMDGYQVLEIFKTEPGLKGTPVVAITANAMPRDIERGRAAGFVDYLTKPLDLEQLLTTVKRCLADGEDRGEGDPRMNP